MKQTRVLGLLLCAVALLSCTQLVEAHGGAVTSGGIQAVPSKLTWQVCVATAVAACGGAIFGWDNGVTGGVEAMPSWQARFFPEILNHPADSSAYCKYDNPYLQLFTSSLFLAAAFSALIGGSFTTRFGRRVTIITGGSLFIAGTVLQTAAFVLPQLIVGRLVLGLGVGLTVQAVPMFLSEMAPPQHRGALNCMFQLATTIGILVAQLVNYAMAKTTYDWNWRLSVGLAIVPALVLTVGTILLTDSPAGLVARGKREEAQRVLRKIRGVDDIELEYQELVIAADISAKVGNPWRTIFKRRYMPQLIIAICMPAFQQLSGINSVMFYAPQLFEALGSGGDAALLNTVIMGAVNVGATFVAILMVDWYGRKALLGEGGFQMGAALIAIAAVLGVGFKKFGSVLPDDYAAGVLFLICLFVAGFAWSWGPLAWLVPTEIQTLETRSAGMAITTSINFLFSFFVGQAFNSMLCGMQFGVFLFFAGWVIIATLFVLLLLPETKGVPLEEVEALFMRHWVWSRLEASRLGLAEKQTALEMKMHHAMEQGTPQSGQTPLGTPSPDSTTKRPIV